MAGRPRRDAVLAVAALAALGTMVELALIGHWHGPAQLAPWLVAHSTLTAAWLVSGGDAPRGWRLRLGVARALCLGDLLACGWGVALHLRANWGFAAELDRSGRPTEVALDAVRGRIPLLAPAFGAVAALLVLVAVGGPDGRRAGDGPAPAGQALRMVATNCATSETSTLASEARPFEA